MFKLSIIIPFLNEEANISFLSNSLSDYFNVEKRFEVEVIFVDDGSTDNSKSILVKHKHKNYKSKLVKLSKNFGSHAALRAGIQNSTGDFITFLYADLQDPISVISKMFDKIESDNTLKIVWANRKASNIGIVNLFFSKLYSLLMRKFVLENYPYQGFDIVMFSKKVSTLLNNNIESNSSIFLQILSFGFKQDFITYNKIARHKGTSKWTTSKKFKLLVDSFIAFSFVPIRFVTIVGLFLFAVGCCFSLYIFLRKIFINDLNAGWPMLISIITLGFGVTNISLGILAEYLWRTLDISRKRPVFIIEEVIKI